MGFRVVGAWKSQRKIEENSGVEKEIWGSE